MSLFKKIARTPPVDLALLGESLFLLGVARLALKTLPLRVLSRHFSKPPKTISKRDENLIERVRWAAIATARRTPFAFVCFPQAIAAQSMLRRRGIASTIHYGVKRDREGKPEAHVWLLAGDVSVVGGERAANFRVLKTFPETGGRTERDGLGSYAMSAR